MSLTHLRQSVAAKLASRFLLYVVVALGFLLVCVVFVVIAVYSGQTRGLPVGWFGLAGFTPPIFWAAVKPLKWLWNRPAFWLAVAALLGLHLLAFMAILLRYPQWPLLWFVPIGLIEAGVLFLVLDKLFNYSQMPSKRDLR